MIEANEIALPMLQRDFVWGPNRMGKLFDSVLQGFPISGMLFWKMPHDEKKSLRLYHIHKYFTEFRPFDSNSLETNQNKELEENQIDQVSFLILDGQQRLTTFCIGLLGSYAWKNYGAWSSIASNFPRRQLFICLNEAVESDQNLDETPMRYRFDWRKIESENITGEPFHNDDKNLIWMRMGHVMSNANKQSWLNESSAILAELPSWSKANDEEIGQSISLLGNIHDSIHEQRCIHFYQDESKSLGNAIETFIRVNSGGMVLAYSDLLFAVLSTNWRDAKTKVDELIRDLSLYQTGRDLRRSFILKTALCLASSKNVTMGLSQFTSERLATISSKWDEIASAIKAVAQLIHHERVRYCSTDGPITILAHYWYQANTVNNYQPTENDKYAMYQWLIRAQLTWSWEKANTETKLNQYFAAISNGLGVSKGPFPFNEATTKGWTSLSFEKVSHEGLLQVGKYQFLLGLLQPNVTLEDAYDIDHCFPFSEAWKTEPTEEELVQHEEYARKVDSIVNMQLLKQGVNRSKGDKGYYNWVQETFPSEEERSSYLAEHLVPQGFPKPLEENLTNAERRAHFEEFYAARYELMHKRLKEIFQDPS